MFNASELVSDLSWLDDANCADLTIDDFFVLAGHVISEDVLEVCRNCPVRIQCVTHSYDQGISVGYFAGISPGQRRDMTLVEALAYVAQDPPKQSPSA